MVQGLRHVLRGRRSEEGAVLMLTLIMLAITLAIIPALVSFMITGSRTGVMYEQKNSELYTADAGVQDAVQLIVNSLETDRSWVPPTDPYLQSAKYGPDINGRDAQVSISEYVKDGIKYYRIFSQGQTPVIDQETTITAFVNAFDAYGWEHSENAFTSPEQLDFKSGHGGNITGGAQLPQGQTGNGYIDQINYDPILGWPGRSYFTEYYAAQVSGTGVPGGVIDIAKNIDITQGMINQDGDLTIDPQGAGSLTLLDDVDGTVWYIHGDLIVNRASTQGTFDINLNGQTIFVEGSITQETNSGNKIVQFNGPGVIIALGDISFSPAAAYDSEGEPDRSKYIYIASVEGSVNIWPRGAFVGSIFARGASTIQPSTELTFLEDPTFGGLNLPSPGTGGGSEIVIGGIESWTIDDPSGNSGISITPFWLPYGDVDLGYPSQMLSASGGTAPYVWLVSSGALPTGLVLDSSGVVSGTANETGKFYFVVQATDSSSPTNRVGKQTIVLTINELPEITLTTLPSGKVGQLYSEFIPWQGGTPAFTWSITPGQLPPGLELLPSTGNIVGTPTTQGTYVLDIRLTDRYGAYDTVSRSVTINP